MTEEFEPDEVDLYSEESKDDEQQSEASEL